MGSAFSSCRCNHDVNEDAHIAPVALTRSTPAPVQPELNPDAWLLTASEITAFRGGHERSDLQCATQKNAVALFPSGAEGFAAMFTDMEAASGPEDSIWIAGWMVSTKWPLVPTGSTPDVDATTLESILIRAVLERGVHVRLLLWANLFQFEEIVEVRDWLNALAPPVDYPAPTNANNPKRGSCLCVFDDRLPHPSSSHHQKMVVVKRQNRLIAHVGGLDLTRDRWDTVTHDQAKLRRGCGIFEEFDGWLDSSMRFEGPMVLDVAATFSSRWNSAYKPCVDLDDKVLKFENPPDVRNVIPFTACSPPSVMGSDATAHVQVVRTFSGLTPKMYPEFAPKGELTLLHSRIKAIRQARNYIYIEDQYFFFMPQLMEALLEVMPRLLRVIVVVQRPTVSKQGQVAGYEKLVFQMAHPLLKKFPSIFKIYTTQKSRNLYIHSKILIVDDVFVSIGSCNWNRRSTTSDSEIAASVVDDHENPNTMISLPENAQIRVGKRVRKFRLQKFAEKIGAKPEDLENLGLVESCELLDKAANDPLPSSRGLLDTLTVDAKWEFVMFPPSYTLLVVDPDDFNEEDE